MASGSARTVVSSRNELQLKLKKYFKEKSEVTKINSGKVFKGTMENKEVVNSDMCILLENS